MKMRPSPDAGLLVIRLYFGLVIAVYHGVLNKLADLATFTGRLSEMGLSAPRLQAVLAGLAQTVGGLLVASGVYARAGALAVLPTVLFAAVWVHRAGPWIKQDFAFAYSIAMVAIIVSGPGRYTLAALWDRRAAAKAGRAEDRVA